MGESVNGNFDLSTFFIVSNHDSPLHENDETADAYENHHSIIAEFMDIMLDCLFNDISTHITVLSVCQPFWSMQGLTFDSGTLPLTRYKSGSLQAEQIFPLISS
jgi:hypothetical protein